MADDALIGPTPPPDTWSAEDGRHLRSQREAAGIDRVQLARQCTLSTTQLQQLEDGGDGAFYSPAIKLAAGLRALERLGGTRPARAVPDTAPPATMTAPKDVAPAQWATDVSEPPTAGAAIPAPTPQAPDPSAAVGTPQADRGHGRPHAQPAARPTPQPESQPTASPAPRADPRPDARPAPSDSPPRRSFAAPIAWAGLALIVGAALVIVASRLADKPTGGAPLDRAAAQARSQGPSTTSASAALATGTSARPGSASGTPSGGSADKTASTSAPMAAATATATATTSQQTSAAQPDPPRGTTASGVPTKQPVMVQSSVSEACETTTATIVEATPPTADRTPDYVYLVAQDNVTICLGDATQTGKPVDLTAGKGLKVTGEPPFVLSGKGLADVDVYFQGNRIRAHQGGNAVTLRLLPR